MIKNSEPAGTKELPKQILDELLSFTGCALSDNVAVLAVTYNGKPRHG